MSRLQLLSSQISLWAFYFLYFTYWEDWSKITVGIFIGFICSVAVARMLPFYLNYYLWTPKFLIKEEGADLYRWLAYSVGGFVVIFVGWYLFRDWLGWTNAPESLYNFITASITNGFICLGISSYLSMKMAQLQRESELEGLMEKKEEMEMKIREQFVDIPFVSASLSELESSAEIDPVSVGEPIVALSSTLKEEYYREKGKNKS